MKLIATTALIAGLFAGSVSAATINNVSGNVFEGGNYLVGPQANDLELKDFDETAGDPLLVLSGNTTVFGFVAHRTASLFTDQFAMDFGSDTYAVTFTWQAKGTSNFDGTLFAGTTTTGFSGVGSAFVGNFSGATAFNIDPKEGLFGNNPDEEGYYSISAVKISAVPLPAGAALLLSGLAGLGLAKRRKTA